MDNGVLPGFGKLTVCETGVENEEKDVTDGVETKFEDPDADTVRASGRIVFHRKEDRPRGLEWDRAQRECTGAHPGKSARKLKGLPPVPDLSRDSRTYPHKVLVQLGGGGRRRDSGGPPAVNHLPYISKDGGRTLPSNPAGDIIPHVSLDGRLDLLTWPTTWSCVLYTHGSWHVTRNATSNANTCFFIMQYTTRAASVPTYGKGKPVCIYLKNTLTKHTFFHR